MNGRPRPQPQGAFCPLCGRHVALTVDGHLECHTPQGDPYSQACPRDLPALPQRRTPR